MNTAYPIKLGKLSDDRQCGGKTDPYIMRKCIISNMLDATHQINEIKSRHESLYQSLTFSTRCISCDRKSGFLPSLERSTTTSQSMFPNLPGVCMARFRYI
jgi:hypothetical protein